MVVCKPQHRFSCAFCCCGLLNLLRVLRILYLWPQGWPGYRRGCIVKRVFWFQSSVVISLINTGSEICR